MSTKTPKVTVVIPTYNRASFLSDTLQSVLGQSCQDFEVVVIDDGSTDNTREVVSAFPAKYIWQENQGCTVAYNRGIEEARGKYIFFLDSDDILLRNALAKGVEVLDQHPEAGFSYGQALFINEARQFLGSSHPPTKFSCIRDGKEEIRNIILSGNYLSAVFVRRSCFDEVGMFKSEFRGGSGDLDLWVRLAKKYAVAYIAEPLVEYRIHPNRITNGRSVKQIEKTWTLILESIFDDSELGAFLHRERPKAYSRLYCRLASDAFNRRQMKIAREYLFRAVRVYPWTPFTDVGLFWFLQFLKSWIPLRILEPMRFCKDSLKTYIWRQPHHFRTRKNGGKNS